MSKGCASSLFHTSSHELHTSVAIYVGKTGSKCILKHPDDILKHRGPHLVRAPNLTLGRNPYPNPS